MRQEENKQEKKNKQEQNKDTKEKEQKKEQEQKNDSENEERKATTKQFQCKSGTNRSHQCYYLTISDTKEIITQRNIIVGFGGLCNCFNHKFEHTR